LIAMGASCDLMIDKFPIPVRNLKRGLTRDQHFAPGTIVRVQVDNTHPLGLGMPWLKGEDLMSGRAAVVSVEMNPGRIVLFGLRPQHRAQTRATFPLLFNALHWAASRGE
jgi:hypothetical protein